MKSPSDVWQSEGHVVCLHIRTNCLCVRKTKSSSYRVKFTHCKACWQFSWFCQHSRQTWRHELDGEVRLCCFEDCERSSGTTEMKQASAVGGDVLAVAGLEAEEVAEFVIASAEQLR